MTYYKILVADDDGDDYSTIYHAFKEIASEFLIDRVKDGEHLLEYLSACIKEKTSLPELILMDINMPKIDGVKALGLVKINPNFSTIPVLMYSTSSDPKVAKECYQLGANGFITKDHSIEKTNGLVNAISAYLNLVLTNPHAPFVFNSKPLTANN